MLSLEELEKIRPGDTIVFEDKWWFGTNVVTAVVKEIACRCGFDKDGRLVEGYDDYVIVEHEICDEVSYKDIIKVVTNE